MSVFFPKSNENAFIHDHFNNFDTKNNIFSNKNVTYTPRRDFNGIDFLDALFDIKPQGIHNRKVTQPQDDLQNIFADLFINMIFFSLLTGFSQTNFNSRPKPNSTPEQNNIPKTGYTNYTNNNWFYDEPRFDDKPNSYNWSYDEPEVNDNTQQLNDALYGLSLEGKDINSLSEKDINSAFRKKARQWHPDKNPSPEARANFDAAVEHKEFLLEYIKLNNSAN